MKKNNLSIRVGGKHPENCLQQARIKAGVSQEETAEYLSCDSRTIQRYEAAKQTPTMTQLLIMKKHYACELANLFPEESLDSNACDVQDTRRYSQI